MQTAIIMEVRRINGLEKLNLSKNYNLADIVIRQDIFYISKTESQKYECKDILKYLTEIKTKDNVQIMVAKKKIFSVRDEQLIIQKLETFPQRYVDLTDFEGKYFAHFPIPKTKFFRKGKKFAFINDLTILSTE